MVSLGCRASECHTGWGLKPGLRVPCPTWSSLRSVLSFHLWTDRHCFLSWQLQGYSSWASHFHCLPSCILATEWPEGSSSDRIRTLSLGALRRSVAFLVADVELFPLCPRRLCGRGPPASPRLYSLLHASMSSCPMHHHFSGTPVGSSLTCSISLSGMFFAPLYTELAPLSFMSPCECPLRETLLANFSEKATCFLYHSSLLFPWWFLSWFIIPFFFLFKKPSCCRVSMYCWIQTGIKSECYEFRMLNIMLIVITKKIAIKCTQKEMRREFKNFTIKNETWKKNH